MIVVAGGTGLLGSDVVARLVRRGLPVRVLSRDPERARSGTHSLPTGVELVRGDVRDPQSLLQALAGASTVIAAVQGFGGRDAGGIGPIDRDGNVNLIRAAAQSGAGHVILLSILGASGSPLALGRAKAVAEAELAMCGVRGTVIRPTAYMETWAGFIGAPILASGRARIFGRGRNPINFVAARDVAPLVERAVADPEAHGSAIDVVGPEDLTLDDVVGTFARVLDREIPASHVPPTLLRVLAMAFAPIRPVLAEQIAGSLVLDRVDMGAVGRGTVTGATRFEDVIRAFVADSVRTAVPVR